MNYNAQNDINTYRSYFENNFAKPFIYGQGTEDILNVIHEFSHAGTCLDLGGGVNSYFWSIPADYTKIVNVDVSYETYKICQELKANRFDQGCYQYAFKRYHRFPGDIYNREMEFICADVLNAPFYLAEQFDTVTQFGLLGLLPSSDLYKSKLLELFSLVKVGGVFIGANWMLSPKLSNIISQSNSYLSPELLNNLAIEANGFLLYNELLPINNDVNYTGVLVYAVTKR